jgi:hypothetical protein
MKTKKGDLLSLWYVLDVLKTKKVNVKFSYFIAKNKLAIRDEINALNEVRAVSETYKLYDGKRGSLAEEMADRVEGTNNPVTRDGQYIITHRKEEFETKLSLLKDEFREAIDERKGQLEKFGELLNEEVEFDGYRILLDSLPQDIEPSVIEVLLSTGLIIEE